MAGEVAKPRRRMNAPRRSGTACSWHDKAANRYHSTDMVYTSAVAVTWSRIGHRAASPPPGQVTVMRSRVEVALAVPLKPALSGGPHLRHELGIILTRPPPRASSRPPSLRPCQEA